MKPNGRRAWRRFAKQQRRKVNRRNRQTGTPWINDADGAFYRHEQKHFEQRPIVPVGPFTAHSLVGMTMGERKRKAWTAYQSGLSESWSFWCAKYGIGESLRHREGERLRPCPGCWNCQTTWQQSSIYSQTAVMHRHGCSHDDPSGLCCFGETVPVKMECDGSGVLPARKQK